MKRILTLILACLMLCSCTAGGNPTVNPLPSEASEAATEPAAEATTDATTTEATTEATTTVSETTTTDTTTSASATTTEATTTEVTTVTTPATEPMPVKSKYDGILHTDGRLIISPEGEELLIKGMAFGNEVWGNPARAPKNHHNEESYRELSEMGFNSVRFYLNYGLFEDDRNPYKYKESGFEWLDKNIAWAKKYGIGLVLNMHYPQGGYQSQGKGNALWDDVENQNRLVALWKEIARRYADEPTIWGYGLINEPVVTSQGSQEETVEFYRDIIQRHVDEIRQVSNQAIFVERICAISYDGNPDWGALSFEDSMPLVEGENIVYEFHNYSPHKFTHQNMDWAGTEGNIYTYPDENTANMDIDSYWKACLYAPKISSNSGWEYREATQIYNGTEDYNIGVLAINGGRIGADATAYFDDLTVTEISPDGEEKIIVHYSFDTDTTNSLYPWSEDGSGKTSYEKSIGYENNGCAKISGATGDYTVSCGERFPLKEGYTYKVSGYIKYENCDSAAVRIDYGHATRIYYLNADYLERELLSAISFSEENNVPIYLGEFGACNEAFKDNRGGERWVGDMMALCRKHSLNFNYHTYHEGSFGLHTDGNALPSDDNLNKALYDCLVKELNK